MHSTRVFGCSFASWLNWRTDMAQVGVSMLGKIFRILRLPARLARVTSVRSLPTRENAGARCPSAESFRQLLRGFRPRSRYWSLRAPLDGGCSGWINRDVVSDNSGLSYLTVTAPALPT